jgi:hypothetical protein
MPTPANDPGGPEDVGREEVRHVDVSPEEVLQPDRRPWARLSLDQVVLRSMMISAAAVAGALAVIAGIGKLAGWW